MPLKSDEQLLLEAVKNLLHQDDSLGIVQSVDKAAAPHDNEETSHTSQFKFENIREEYGLMVVDMVHYDSIVSAFHSTHVYKYIDDHNFDISFENGMRQRAVPEEEIKGALEKLQELRTKYEGEEEKVSGWNPEMEEVAKMTREVGKVDYESGATKHPKPHRGGGAVPTESLELRNQFLSVAESDENWDSKKAKLSQLLSETLKKNDVELAGDISDFVKNGGRFAINEASFHASYPEEDDTEESLEDWKGNLDRRYTQIGHQIDSLLEKEKRLGSLDENEYSRLQMLRAQLQDLSDEGVDYNRRQEINRIRRRR